MSAPHGDGGPAFPGDTATGYMQMDVSGVPHALTEPHQGMTLRDYFAAKAKPALDDDGDPSPYRAALVMGVDEVPRFGADREGKLAALNWWIEADARLRYLHADAMLKARGVL